MLNSEQTTPFDPEFIKRCERRIFKSCHKKQLGFVQDRARFISVLCGRNAGKTTAGLWRLLLRMIRFPNQATIFVATNRKSAKRLAWRDLKKQIHMLGLGTSTECNETELTCTLSNGSSLLLFGCHTEKVTDDIRGTTFHEVGIDECAKINDPLLCYLLDEAIGPRADTVWLTSTPSSQLAGRFYDATRNGSAFHRAYAPEADPDTFKWSSHSWTCLDGVAAGFVEMIKFWKRALHKKEHQGWSDNHPAWMREYLGLWSANNTSMVYAYRAFLDDGHPWNQWAPEEWGKGAGYEYKMSTLVKPPTTYTDYGYGIGVDVGFTDNFSLTVFAYSYSDPSRTLWHVFEFSGPKVYAKVLAQMLIGDALDHSNLGGLFGQIGYPDVFVGDFAGRGADLLAELWNVYGIKITPADKPYKYKDAAIELFNGDLFEGPRIKILKGSEVETEMIALQWVVDEFGRRTENKKQKNDGTDSALYCRNAIVSCLPSAVKTESTPKAHSSPVNDTGRPVARPQAQISVDGGNEYQSPSENYQSPYEDGAYGSGYGSW